MNSMLKKAIDFLPSRCRWTCVLVVAMVTALMAQDPVTSLPENYKREFENEYVRVTRVLYPAHAKLPGHAHTPLATAYVYLNDSGPVAFKHIGAEYGAVTRPPTVARSFRLYRGLEEVHEVENLSDRPSEFLRVEFKTDPVDPPTLRGKFASEPTSEAVMQKVQFENAQVRITRLRWRNGNDVKISNSIHPSLLVSLTDGEMGYVRWLRQGHSDSLTSTTPATGEAIRIEFKTRPLGQS
jgi:hypothetical protein